MKKKSKLVVAILLVIALFAVIIGIVLYVANEKKEVTVYAWARTIQYSDKANYQVAAADIAESTVLSADMSDDYILSPNDVIGRYITGTAYKGQKIIKGQLSVDPTYVEAGGISELADYRKFYVDVNYSTAFAGDIKAGQCVDLLYEEFSSGEPTDRTQQLFQNYDENQIKTMRYGTAKIIMQNVPIYQVYTSDGSVFVPKDTSVNAVKTDEEKSAGAPAFVALTVTVEQYEELKARLNFGTISLVSRFDGSADVNTEGYTAIKTKDANLYIGKGHLEYDPQLDMSDPDNLIWDKENADIPVAGKEEAEAETVEEATPAASTNSLSEFMRKMQMVDCNDTQRKTLRSVVSRYRSYMTTLLGSNWESNSPEKTTVEDIRKSLGGVEEKEKAFDEWLADTEGLAKELFGEGVELPW